MDLFTQPLSDVSLPVNSLKTVGIESSNVIPSFICMLEGWKTRIKNLHWAASNINIHKLLDEIMECVSEFQDNLAEDYMGINGKFNSTFLKGSLCNCTVAKDLLKEIMVKTKSFYERVPSSVEYKGIKSEAETFIHNINKYLYLVELC